MNPSSYPQRVVVTGGTRGIGLATARRFSSDGAAVVAIGRTPAPVPDGVHLVTADLTSAGDVEAAAEQALEVLGEIDVLVDNVGGATFHPEDPLATTDEEWQYNLDVNLMSAVRLDRALLPHMTRRRSGIIIHVSSVGARMIRSDVLAYSAAKAALNAYSKGLATIVGDQGVRVCLLSPGVIATEIHGLTEIAERTGRDPAEVRREYESNLPVPLGRLGEPEEIAEVIAFLASPRASYLTGVNVGVDGGLLATV